MEALKLCFQVAVGGQVFEFPLLPVIGGGGQGGHTPGAMWLKATATEVGSCEPYQPAFPELGRDASDLKTTDWAGAGSAPHSPISKHMDSPALGSKPTLKALLSRILVFLVSRKTYKTPTTSKHLLLQRISSLSLTTHHSAPHLVVLDPFHCRPEPRLLSVACPVEPSRPGSQRVWAHNPYASIRQ